MEHTIDSDGDPLYDINYNNNNNNKEKDESIGDYSNEETNDNNGEEEDNEDTDEDTDQDSDEEEEDEDVLNRDDLNDNSHEFRDNNNKNNSSIDLLFDNYGNSFDEQNDDQNNSTHIRGHDIKRFRIRSKDSTEGDSVFSGQVLGRSADGFKRPGLSNAQFKDLHGNKVNIEDDPQQPSYDEAIASIVDEMGGIHIHDGPGGTFSLPDKNQIHLQESILNYNDKDFGFIEKITADRRPIVRVTRVRKRVRTDSEEAFDDTEPKTSYVSEKNIKNQYIPVIVMDKEDMDSAKEEKIRRYRSDNHYKNSEYEENPSSMHFQNQKRQQQQHFRDQSRQKVSLNGALPIAMVTPETNKSLELRGFVATRNDAGKMIAIPIFKDMINGIHYKNIYFNVFSINF